MSASWRKILGMDLRSLALFRIALGTYVVVDLVLRLGILSESYTDDGFLPRDGRILLAKSPGS